MILEGLAACRIAKAEPADAADGRVQPPMLWAAIVSSPDPQESPPKLAPCTVLRQRKGAGSEAPRPVIAHADRQARCAALRHPCPSPPAGRCVASRHATADPAIHLAGHTPAAHGSCAARSISNHSRYAASDHSDLMYATTSRMSRSGSFFSHRGMMP